jgi:hypothetical protein
MAISADQNIDFLIKKIGYGVAKTDTFGNKGPANEVESSPLLNRADTILLRSELIPTIPPTVSDETVEIYKGVNRVQCTADTTSTPNRTWKTNLKNWISTEFGTGYQVAVYIDDEDAVDPSLTGTRIFPSGSGNNDSWFFDHQAGILNFADTNVPSGLTTGKRIFVEGYRYVNSIGLEDLIASATGGPFNGDLYGSVYTKEDNILLVDGTDGKIILSYNTTDDLPEGTDNQYYTVKRVQRDARIMSLIFGS